MLGSLYHPIAKLLKHPFMSLAMFCCLNGWNSSLYLVKGKTIIESILQIRVLRGKGFWYPDPVMPRYTLPRPGPDRKIFNFMARPQTNQIIFGLDRTGAKQFIINLKLTSVRLELIREYALQ